MNEVVTWPAREVGVVEHGLEERDVGRDAPDPELRDRPPRLAGRRPRRSRPRQVSLDSIESKCARDLGAGVGRAAVEPDAGAAGGAVRRDHAGVGAEAVGRVLGGDPALERGAADGDRLLREPEVGERRAGRDPQLGLHQVDVGDLLGDRVLDLDPRVHLDEDVVAVGVEQELDGAGVAVADLAGEADGVGAHPLADLRVEVRRRRDLDDLLVPALHRAVALEEVHHLARAVGQDLHLDVARVDDRLLDEHGRVAEGALGLAHAGLDRLAQVLGAVDPAHAATAAAGDRLDEQREGIAAAASTRASTSVRRLDARQGRHAGRLGRGDGPRLVAGQLEDLGRRPDEGDAGVGARLGQGRVLGQEAVARVDRVRARPARATATIASGSR